MPSAEERLSRLESHLELLEGRLGELLELINSGPRVPWEQSIRGRLHSMRSSQLAAEQLAQAAREVRRARAHSLSVTERVLLLIAAIAAALAPYVILFAHVL